MEKLGNFRMYFLRSFILLLLTAVDYGENGNPCEPIPDDPACANEGKCIVVSENSFKCECGTDFEGEFCQNKNLCKYFHCENGGFCHTKEDIPVCECPIGYTGIHCEDSQEKMVNEKSITPKTVKQKNAVPKTLKPKNTTPKTVKNKIATPKKVNQKSTTPKTGKQKGTTPKTGKPKNEILKAVSTSASSKPTVKNKNSPQSSLMRSIGRAWKKPSAGAGADECDRFDCGLNGSCIVLPDSAGILKPECNCNPGFAGTHCETKIAPPCQILGPSTTGCQNGGTCTPINGTHVRCACTLDFTGPRCENPNPCKTTVCAHGEDTQSVIINGNNYCRCICSASFSGEFCQHPNPCLSTPCLNGGVCNPLDDGSYYCDCKAGHYSTDCRIRNPCAGHSACQNGATCVPSSDRYDFSCSCQLPFEGEHCETLNLCLVDMGECQDDISINQTKVGNCYPCFTNQTCERRAQDVYTCLDRENFESPSLLKVMENGTFSSTFIDPLQQYEYTWNLDPKNELPNSLKLSRQAKPPAAIVHIKAYELSTITPDPSKIIKTHNFTFYYNLPGVYPVEVTRIDTISRKRQLVWKNDVTVEGNPCSPQYASARNRITRYTKLAFAYPIVHNPLIPTIVIFCLIIYVLLLMLTCFCQCKNKMNRPRLIVSADIQRFDEETFYLLTLQTGNRCDGGTSANVACRFYGTRGRSKIYVLRDYKLDTTMRDSEANFLISSKKNLGEMEKIRIWHDNTGYHPSWYCLKIILREVKKDKYWYFFIRRWLSTTSDDTSIVAEATTATEKEVQDYYKEFTHLSKLWLLTKQHHIWISPFLGSSKSGFTIPERLTVAMTLLCCHMFLLILIYGTPLSLDLPFVFQWGLFEFNLPIILASLKVAPASILIGLLLTYLFRALHKKRVPTLLVWRNKPDMPSYEEYQAMLLEQERELKRNVFLHTIPLHGQNVADDARCEEVETSDENSEIDEDERWSKLDPNRIMVVGVPKSIASSVKSSESYHYEEIPSSTTSSNEAFRIPSTDMLETRHWISEALDDSQGPVNITPNDLVHSVQMEKPFPGPDRLVELGMVGGVISVKDDHPESFVYRTNSTEIIESLIEEDIRRSYIRPSTYEPRDHSSGNFIKIYSNKPVKIETETVDTCNQNTQTDPLRRRRRIRQVLRQPTALKRSVYAVNTNVDILEMRSGSDEDDMCCGEHFYNTKQVYLELCEMPIEGRRRESLISIAWLVSITLIILTSSLTIVFGSRYGQLRSYNWCASLCWGFVESFLLFQPLKVLIIGCIIVYCVETGKRLPLALRHNRERFQVYCANGLTVLPRIYPLHYFRHIPDILYRPIIASQIFAWKMESRRKRLLRRGLMEVIIYFIFIAVVVTLAYYHRGMEVDFYDSAKRLEDVFLLKEAQVERSPYAYQKIKNVPGYYRFLENVLVKGMYHEHKRDIDGNLLVVDHTSPIIWMQGQISILIGIPRIRQLRIVQNSDADKAKGVGGTCDMRYQFKEDKFTHPTTNFSRSTDFEDGDFYSNKDTNDYLIGWKRVPQGTTRVPVPSLTNDIWKFHSADENKSMNKFGVVSWYDGSGYVAELGRVEAKTLDVISYMKKYKWIDERTRALMVEFSAYNPHINVYNSVILLTERTASLSWVVSSTITTSQLFDHTKISFTEIFALMIFILCTIYFSISSVLSVISSWKRSKLETLKNMWLYIGVAIPMFCVAAMVLYIVSAIRFTEKVREIEKSHPTKYIDLQSTINMAYIEIYVLCTVMGLAVCKLWHLLVISSRSFFVIGFVFSITTSFSMHFLLIFLVLHLAFSSFEFIYFGTRNFRSRTIGRTILNSLYSARFPKNVCFDNLYISDRVFGPIFYFGYNLIIFIFIMNVFISIYTLGLQEAKETALQRPFNSSYITYIWMKLQGLLPRRLRQKLTRRTHITPARLNEMRRIAISTLRTAQHSPTPTEQRMREMKAFVTNLLKGSGLRLISKQQKIIDKQKKIMLIEEDRLNTMRELTVNYIRLKQKMDFSVEELKKYEDFGYELLKIRLHKLQQRLNQVDTLLSALLQRM